MPGPRGFIAGAHWDTRLPIWSRTTAQRKAILRPSRRAVAHTPQCSRAGIQSPTTDVRLSTRMIPGDISKRLPPLPGLRATSTQAEAAATPARARTIACRHLRMPHFWPSRRAPSGNDACADTVAWRDSATGAGPLKAARCICCPHACHWQQSRRGSLPTVHLAREYRTASSVAQYPSELAYSARALLGRSVLDALSRSRTAPACVQLATIGRRARPADSHRCALRATSCAIRRPRSRMRRMPATCTAHRTTNVVRVTGSR